MKQEKDEGTYCLMDFLHLPTAIDLQSLAAALRPLVGADFEFHRDEFVACMASSWNGHEVIIAHPLDATRPEHVAGGQLTESNAATYVTLAVKRPSVPASGTCWLDEDFTLCMWLSRHR